MYMYLAKIFLIDAHALTIAMLMCTVGTFILRESLDNPPVIWVSYPAMVTGALIVQYGFRELAILPFRERGANIALATGIGMTIVLVLIVVLMRIVTEIMDQRRKAQTF